MCHVQKLLHVCECAINNNINNSEPESKSAGNSRQEIFLNMDEI